MLATWSRGRSLGPDPGHGAVPRGAVGRGLGAAVSQPRVCKASVRPLGCAAPSPPLLEITQPKRSRDRRELDVPVLDGAGPARPRGH